MKVTAKFILIFVSRKPVSVPLRTPKFDHGLLTVMFFSVVLVTALWTALHKAKQPGDLLGHCSRWLHRRSW